MDMNVLQKAQEFAGAKIDGNADMVRRILNVMADGDASSPAKFVAISRWLSRIPDEEDRASVVEAVAQVMEGA